MTVRTVACLTFVPKIRFATEEKEREREGAGKSPILVRYCPTGVNKSIKSDQLLVCLVAERLGDIRGLSRWLADALAKLVMLGH